jgi:putative DNA primase/helicase
MMLHDAMRAACAAVGIEVPKRPAPGRWAQSAVIGKPVSNTSGRVMIHEDGQGGVAWNWATGQSKTFTVRGHGEVSVSRPRDLAKERQQEAERLEVAAICDAIVKGCDSAKHPYLVHKGFPDQFGLVCGNPRRFLPNTRLGEALSYALPDGDEPFLIVPGQIDGKITTVQFISPSGAKRNILRGQMGGASHRIATGRETWVCEGIATALSVRAALRLLGRSVTVLSAFSASNVAKVARGIPGAIIAADYDKPVEMFGGLGTGEYYARRSGLKWVMPPALGDWNDYHQVEGLRAVAMKLRGVSGGA